MIQFDLITSDNKLIEVNHFCYGVLKDRLNKGIERRGDVIRDFNRRNVHLAAVVYYPTECSEGVFYESEESEKILELMQEILDAVPFAKRITSLGIHPVTGSPYAKVQAGAGVCVDHTMMVLFLLRNLTYIEDMYNMYATLRGSGYTPLASVAISGLLSSYKNFNGNRHVYIRAPGEYNLFNRETFGRRAMVKFLHGQEPEWYQGDWPTDHVYHRDSWFIDHGIFFHDLWGQENSRLLIDVLSEERDEEFLDRRPFDEGTILIDQLNEVVAHQFGDVFREAGVPLF